LFNQVDGGAENGGRARCITYAKARSYGATIVVLGILTFSGASQARNYGQYKSASLAIRMWIEGLTDNLGVPCCATADGAVPDVWEMRHSHYRVKIYGEWLVVPDSAVVRGQNHLGHAVVWVDSSENFMQVRCFLPGSQS
jgi:hypothetical protein